MTFLKTLSPVLRTKESKVAIGSVIAGLSAFTGIYLYSTGLSPKIITNGEMNASNIGILVKEQTIGLDGKCRVKLEKYEHASSIRLLDCKTQDISVYVRSDGPIKKLNLEKGNTFVFNNTDNVKLEVASDINSNTREVLALYAPNASGEFRLASTPR